MVNQNRHHNEVFFNYKARNNWIHAFSWIITPDNNLRKS